MRKLICPTCRAKLLIPTDMMGQPTKCPTCFTEVPAQAPAPRELVDDSSSQLKVSDSPNSAKDDISKTAETIVPHSLQNLRWSDPPATLLHSTAAMQNGIAKLKIGKPMAGLAEVKASKLVWLGGGFVVVFTLVVLGHQIGLLKSVDKKLLEQAWVGIPFGAVILAIGLLLTRWAGGRQRTIPNLTLWIYSEGLVWQRMGESAVWTWNDIKTARVIETGVSELDFESKEFEYELTGNDGETIRLSTSSEPLCRDAAEFIMEQSAAAALPMAKQKVESGDVCTFGKVKIHKNGLTVGRDEFSWEEIRKVDFDHSQFRVFRRDGEPVVVWGKQVENPLLAITL